MSLGLKETKHVILASIKKQNYMLHKWKSLKSFNVNFKLPLMPEDYLGHLGGA